MGICNDGLSRRMSCWFSDSRRHWGSKIHLLIADGVRVVSSDKVRVISSDGISLRLLRGVSGSVVSGSVVSGSGVSGSGVSGSGVSSNSEGLINLSEYNIVGVIDGDGGSVVVVVVVVRIRHTGSRHV